MAVGSRTPVSALEGVGPATEEALADVGVFSVFDLLRGTEDVIHPAVRQVASLDEVRAWRVMAALLQVAEVTPQGAEALQRAGVEGLEDLGSRSLSEVTRMFDEAVASGVIPAAPSSDEISRMIADAGVIHSRGALTGTVLDDSEDPVLDAEVRVGDLTGSTDVRGRFRIIRIPLGRRPVATISHPAHELSVIVDPPIAVDPDMIGVTIFRLSPPRTDAGEGRLSEYEGDVLPPISGHPVRLEELDPADPREGDLFVINEVDDRGVMLVSRFRSYEGGRFLVGRMRVPADRLPSGAGHGDHVRYWNGSFTAVAMDARRHRIALALRRMERALGRGDRPRSVQELDRHLTERLSFLLEGR